MCGLGIGIEEEEFCWLEVLIGVEMEFFVGGGEVIGDWFVYNGVFEICVWEVVGVFVFEREMVGFWMLGVKKKGLRKGEVLGNGFWVNWE